MPIIPEPLGAHIEELKEKSDMSKSSKRTLSKTLLIFALIFMSAACGSQVDQSGDKSSGMSAEEKEALAKELVRQRTNASMNLLEDEYFSYVHEMFQIIMGYPLTDVSFEITKNWTLTKLDDDRYSVDLATTYGFECLNDTASTSNCDFVLELKEEFTWGAGLICSANFRVIISERVVLPQNECAEVLTSSGSTD